MNVKVLLDCVKDRTDESDKRCVKPVLSTVTMLTKCLTVDCSTMLKYAALNQRFTVNSYI